MATATFDKRIVLTAEAADKLAEMLREPAPPFEDLGDIIKEGKEAWGKYLASKQQ